MSQTHTNNLVTRYPIHDLNNKLLVPAGTELTPAFMDSLCSTNTKQYTEISLLDHGNILNDVEGLFRKPPYDVVFAEKETIASVLEIMEQIRLPQPIYDCLDFFREHDNYTYRHMLIISALESLILQKIPSRHITKTDDLLLQIGPTHDIGKISVPREILLKETPLTLAELDMVEHHTLAGYVLLSSYYKNHTCLAPMIARDHHERRDGSGYPRGIKQHILVTEITTVCDIYDALIAKRPYRPISYDNRTALEELTWMAQRGEIGMECIWVLVAFNRHRKIPVEECTISKELRGTKPDQNVYGKLSDKGTDRS